MKEAAIPTIFPINGVTRPKRTKDLLLRQGVEDALNTLVDDLKTSNKIPEVSNHLDKFINIIKIEKGTDSEILIEIAEKTKNRSVGLSNIRLMMWCKEIFN